MRTNLTVFGALAVLTAVTVAASYLHLSRAPAIAVAVAIAALKASLIAAFFMHLKFERRLILWIFCGSLVTLLVFLVPVLVDIGY